MCQSNYELNFRYKSLTFFLVVISVIVYGFILSFSPDERLQIIYNFGVNNSFDYRILTATFIHASFQHLLFNLLWIVVLGSWIESEIGSLQYLLFVLFSSCVSWAYLIALSPSKTAIGASGLVFGHFGAALGLKIQSRIGIILAFVVLGLNYLIRQISNESSSIDVHLSGFIVGYILTQALLQAKSMFVS